MGRPLQENTTTATTGVRPLQGNASTATTWVRPLQVLMSCRRDVVVIVKEVFRVVLCFDL